MKENYDFSKMKNIRKNPHAEHLKKYGHVTRIYHAPDLTANVNHNADFKQNEERHLNEFCKNDELIDVSG